MSMTLYHLPDAFKQLEHLIEQADGELTPELESTLDALQCTLQQKHDGICGLVRQFTADADAAKAESDRLAQLAQVRRNRADRLKRYLMETLQRLDMPGLETAHWKTQVAKSPLAVSFHGDPGELPERLARVTIAPDCKAALEMHKSGELLPEGFSVKQSYHLRIS